jgi:hypothetical protein
MTITMVREIENRKQAVIRGEGGKERNPSRQTGCLSYTG